MTQALYTAEAAVAFAGMLADTDAAMRSSISRANEEATAVAYGAGVMFGTLPEEQFLLPDATGFEFAGILVHSHAREDVIQVGPVEGEPNELLRKGRIWVIVEENIVTTDAVFLRHTANGGLLPGGWRKDLDTDKADEITQAKWLTGADAGDPAMLEINYP